MRNPMPRCGLVLLVLLAGLAQTPNPPLPTPADLQQMFDAKAYHICLQNIARVLALTGEAAQPYDRGALFLLRGECLVQLDDPASALLAYEQAITEARTPAQADTARAMVALLKRSPRLTFRPQAAPNAAPLDVKDPTQRKQAMQLLFTEQFAAQRAAIKNAEDAPNLVPIMKLLPELQTLHALEMNGTGNDSQLKPILLRIGTQARELIGSELDLQAAAITRIRNTANTVLAVGNNTVGMSDGKLWWDTTTYRAGLSPDERTALRERIDYLQKIVDACRQGRHAAQSFGADGKNWDPLITQATGLLREAQTILAAE